MLNFLTAHRIKVVRDLDFVFQEAKSRSLARIGCIGRCRLAGLLIEAASSELQSLSDIVVFQLWVFPPHSRSLGMHRKCLDDAVYSQPHSPDAGLPIHDGSFDRDAIELAQHSLAPANGLSEANLRRAQERLEVIKRQIESGTFAFELTA